MKVWTLLGLALTLASAPVAWAGNDKLPLVFEDDFENGAERWQPGDPAAWKITKTDGGKHYHQFQLSKVKTPFRSPFTYCGTLAWMLAR